MSDKPAEEDAPLTSARWKRLLGENAWTEIKHALPFTDQDDEDGER